MATRLPPHKAPHIGLNVDLGSSFRTMPEHLRGGTRRIVGGNGETAAKVLMLTTFDLDEYVYDALRAGTGGRRVIASGR